MKKSSGVIGAVVILGVAYLGTTWYVGKEAQTTIERVVTQANGRLVKLLGPDLSGSGLKVEITNYQRHFFSSDVTYTVHMKDEDDKPIDLKLQDRLQHGPFPLAALRSGDFRPMLAYSRAQLLASPASQKWFDSQQGESPLIVETEVGFGGSGSSVWTFAPTELVEGNEKLSFSGGAINVNFSNDFNDNTASGQFDALSLINPERGQNLALKNIKGNSQTTGSNNEVTTQSTATVDALTIGDATEGAVTIEKLSINLDSHQKDKLLDGSLRYDFGRLMVGNIDLGSVSVGGKTRQLDVAALAALATEYDAIQAKHGGAVDEELILTAEEEAQLHKRGMAVLASNPSLSIDPLVWKNDKGESRALLQIDFVSPANTQSQPTDVLLAEILKRVKLDFSVSRPMFLQAFAQAQGDTQQKQQMEMLGALIYDQYVARFRDAGLVKVDGDAAAAKILYEKDSVEVNGQLMPVSEFMQRAMSVLM
ncbi:DUF945 domain-containing protein [Candidimonas sp. SYP-B2681]|uniref:YdgA family protein n=1 Tax=Candidimonas sp. SYP-B2681 TaxID=2497686 RepID=UPI000F89B937|nr:YdgA family protein [Candidimonas sp. SYP-B2681]RTZ42563.1 DUF945 domain-containing protein [Candidimonas sp. SYP-B2681]